MFPLGCLAPPAPPPSPLPWAAFIQDTSSHLVCLKLNHLKRAFLKVKKKQKACINIKGRGVI